MGDRTSTWIRPVLSSELDVLETDEMLRIAIIGEFLLNGEETGEVVGAYSDILLGH